jgi:glycosyltransferase involved in cell wall biosynthesis
VTPAPLRVLCLDIEGGFGGSSRSLYYLLKHVDRSCVTPEVWCRRAGPILPLYESIGIPVRVEPALPKVSSLPRFSRNVWALAQYLVAFSRSRPIRQRLVTTINDRFNVVHFNHEAFYQLAAWLRPKVKAAFVMHNRTQLKDSWFARRQARHLVSVNDINIFITECERDNIRLLADWDRGTVIHNVVDVPDVRPQPHPAVPTDGRFTIACLSSYSWLRGVDRLIDVAVALRSIGSDDIRFVMGGNFSLSGSLPGLLGDIAVKGGTLADYAAVRGVADSFIFLGHVAEPERVLAASHALAKPSREDNPWGRDILEALAIGLPVLACGTYDRFVKPGVSGYLYHHDDKFDPLEMATDIAALAADPLQREMMSAAAVECVRTECDGQARATDLVKAWERAYACARARA